VTAAAEAAASITTMRQAAADAHSRYTRAIETNLQTLGRK
jgi:hypothetical protein